MSVTAQIPNAATTVVLLILPLFGSLFELASYNHEAPVVSLVSSFPASRTRASFILDLIMEIWKSSQFRTRKKILNLVDPKNCVHEVFLNLNLSGSPFRYYYVLKQYTYLNCSVKLPVPSFTQVPCLSSAPHSNHHHHVYIVEPSLSSVPDSCTPLKTIGIPFSYSPYISDNSFGLRLSWDSTDDQEKHVQSDDIETNGTPMRRSWIDIIYYKVLGLAMFIFMVMTLAFLKTSYLDEENDKELKKQNPIEAQTLLRDSATLGV